jgi:hypothetical protein
LSITKPGSDAIAGQLAEQVRLPDLARLFLPFAAAVNSVNLAALFSKKLLTEIKISVMIKNSGGRVQAVTEIFHTGV